MIISTIILALFHLYKQCLYHNYCNTAVHVTCSWCVILANHTHTHTRCDNASLTLTTHADRTFAHCYGSSFHGAVTASEGNVMKLPGCLLLSTAPHSLNHCVLGILLHVTRNLVYSDVASESLDWYRDNFTSLGSSLSV